MVLRMKCSEFRSNCDQLFVEMREAGADAHIDCGNFGLIISIVVNNASNDSVFSEDSSKQVRIEENG